MGVGVSTYFILNHGLSTNKYGWLLIYNLQLTYYRRRMQGTLKYPILDGRFSSWWWGKVNFLFTCFTKATQWAFIIETFDLAQIYIHRISRHYFGDCSRSPQSCRSVSFRGTQAALWVFHSTSKSSLHPWVLVMNRKSWLLINFLFLDVGYIFGECFKHVWTFRSLPCNVIKAHMYFVYLGAVRKIEC